jgi:hypothetical protein
MTDFSHPSDEWTLILELAKQPNVAELKYKDFYIKFKDKEPLSPSYTVSQWPVYNQSVTGSLASAMTGLAQKSVPDAKAEDLIKPLNPLDDLTPEEILYYAVPHYDQIQAEKEAHKKKLEDEKINGG